jgi:putative ABC transport system permease protein
MSVRELFREAAENLAAHRLRTALASLGVLTGVAAVVTAMAISAGAERQALAEISALGIDNLIVLSIAPDGSHRAPELRLSDAETLRRAFRHAAVAPLRRINGATAGADAAVVAGVTSQWRTTSRLDVANGRWLRDDDRRGVAVLGEAVARRQFPGENPIGRVVLAAGDWRTVIGVLSPAAARGASVPAQALDVDRTIFVPLAASDQSLGDGDDGTAVHQIVMRIARGVDPSREAESVRRALARDHEPSTFDVLVPRELLRAKLRAQRTFRAVMFAVGGLALLVSGIGITNIMVSSVSERAAEIGLRRAVGARRREVVRQFAAEAIVLSAMGGAAGILAGAAAAGGIALVAAWPVAITPASVFVSLGLAAVVGLASGIYPAHLAASMTPVDALRS